MGDLETDTAVEPLGGGCYRATPDPAWEIWGPEGGYLASLALRAAGAEATFSRPASFSCHYLGVAAFEPVELQVEPLRRGRNAESLRVSVLQGDRRILEATVWVVAEVEGLEHAELSPPAVPDPEDLPTMAERWAEAGIDPPAGYPFWDNFDARAVDWDPDWPPPGPLPPEWRQWERFLPRSTFTDPWVDAARSLVLVDVVSWPAAVRQHVWRWPERPEWMAPSLDLYVAFHEPDPEEPWLLAEGHAPFAADGLVGWTGRLWSRSGRLVASGGGQLLCRRLPPPDRPVG